MKFANLMGLYIILLVSGCNSLTTSTVPIVPESSVSAQPTVQVQYFGHASFLLQFDNGISVLTDYGQSNAYGLDSPICELMGVEPDIFIFSHNHPDHKRPDLKMDQAHILTEMDSLSLQGLQITPIRTSEMAVGVEDNTSYLITYKGLKILHLADAQALIKAIDDNDVQHKVLGLYPDTYDLLLMTIEGRTTFIPQAEVFISLLQPARVIPMHYWSSEYKADFLAYLDTQNQETARQYDIEQRGTSGYDLFPEETLNSIQVISLEPADLSSSK